MRRFSTSASASPNTMLSGTYNAVYTSVLPTACPKFGSRTSAS
jgi:hypothetical protein